MILPYRFLVHSLLLISHVFAVVELTAPHNSDQFGTSISADTGLVLVGGTSWKYAFTRASDGTWEQSAVLGGANPDILDTPNVAVSGDFSRAGSTLWTCLDTYL